MPLIPESNALMLAQNFDSLDTERQAKAREILRQYRDQQDELGLPEWPSQAAAEQESKTRLRGFFEDLKTVDAAAPSLASVLPYSENPDADRARVANTAYMASRYGKTADEIGSMYDLYRDDLAARIGGKPGLDDLAFHSVLKGEVEKEKRKEQSFQSGAVSAVSGKSALAALAEWQAANPDAKDDTPYFMQAFTTASSRIRPHLPMVKEIADAIEADMNGKGDAKAMQALSERLVEMSGKERRMVIAGLRMEAENRGKGAAEQKGGMLGGNFWQQVGESAGRFVIGGLSGTSNMKLADGLKSIPETGSVVWTGGAIDTPEKAREFVSGELSRSMSEQVQTAFIDNPSPVARNGEPVTLDAKATNLIREAKARVEKRIRVAQEMAAIGSEIDPLPSVVASTLGTSGALLGGAILTRGMSAPMAAQLYAGTEYEEMSRKFPMMSDADKQGIAALSGSLQAGLDLVGVKGLDKLPAVQTLLKQGLTRTIAGRAAGQFGKSFAVENLVEGAQDIATPTIMAALASDVPGYDWNAEAQNWWKNRADVAVGLLPLTLLGVGAVSARDALGAQSLLGWDLKLASAGVLAADRTNITDLARNGDVEGAQAVLKEAWSRRSPKEASEHQAKIAARDAEAQAAFEEAARIGLLPTIRRDSSGYTVTNNTGESVSFGSWQDARDAASEGMTDVERSGIDAIAAMADHFLKSNPNEVFEFKPGESMTLKGRVASGELSAEEATHAAIVAGQLDGMTKEEAQNATWTVLGNNRVELAENVRRSVSTIFSGGNVLTAVEEPVEGRWKAGIASGRYTREGGIEWVRLAEQATGEKFLPDGDISDRALIEAISKIVVADVFGRRKDGSRIAPGAVTMGAKSSLQQSAGARGLSAFLRAFRAFFGQVFKVARALAKARKDGKLSADWESQLDELLGIDSQQQHETEAAKEADAIANEALYAGASSYSETNPGPNGETFSMTNEPSPGGLSEAEVSGVLYRGEHEGNGTLADNEPGGIHFSTNESYAKQYGDLRTVYVSLRRALNFLTIGKDFKGSDLLGFLQKHGVSLDEKSQDWFSGKTIRQIIKPDAQYSASEIHQDILDGIGHLIKAAGYDGYIFPELGEFDHPSVVVFSEKSISPFKGEKPQTKQQHGKQRTVDSARNPNQTERSTLLHAPRVSGGIEIRPVSRGSGENQSPARGDLNSAKMNQAGKPSRLILDPVIIRMRSPFGEPQIKTTPGSGRSLEAATLNTKTDSNARLSTTTLSPSPPEVNYFNLLRASGGESFNLRKFDFSSRLAPAAETLAKMRQGGKAFDFASLYKAASVGQSSSMLPLDRLFDAAKRQNPALTEADFGKQIQALYDSGELMLEPGESPDSMRESLSRFGVRDSLGVPAMFAGALNEFGRAIPADASKQTIMPDGARLVGPTTFELRAYHGTPHKVDKFRLDKIGTGEGAQAYGWGLYFAEGKDVGEQYQKSLTANIWNVPGDSEASNLARDLLKQFRSKPTAINQLWFTLVERGSISDELASNVEKAISNSTYEGTTGNLYTVELLPDADEFLDWDKPLSEQSEKVKAALGPIVEKLISNNEGFVNQSLKKQAMSGDLAASQAYFLIGGELSINAGDGYPPKLASEELAKAGIPGIRYLDGGSRGAGDGTYNYVIFDENLVRILEENGKPVESFSIRPGNFASRMDAAFSPFQRSPELRMAIAQVAKQRAQRLGAEWIEKAAVLRSARDIGREQRFREADGFDRRMQAYLDSLTPSARQKLEFEPAELESDPLVSAMLDFGKLMSQSTAKKLGKVEAKAGDYDGAPWLPPAWYSKGSGIMPDVMAQAMHDQGLLPDASTDALWSALASRIESTRKNKASHREAVKAYQDAKKTAKADAKLEAEAWANQARKEAGSPKAQRDMLKAALRTLDGILSAAPAAVRVKVGGYVKMAGLATDGAMLDEIERRIEKLNTELEKWLKKEAVSEIRSLLKQGRPDMSAGKKGKGKDADMHTLLAAAETAADMDALAVAGRLADLDTHIASGELTPEQEALAMVERGIIELVGDLDNADSGRAFSALDSLREIYTGGWLKWKLAEIERKERRAGMRQDFIAATGKSGVGKERDAADKRAKTLLGMAKAKWLSLSSFGDVLRYAFGEGSLTSSLIDSERMASNLYEDANQQLADEVERLFESIAGSRLAGEKLRFEMAQKSISTSQRELSQLEAIQALLMWRQEDGRRHMEGTRDENGKVTSSWSYDQAWIDEVEKALTPEARRVMGWIMTKYGAEHATLNPLYRARYGVNLPQHDNYAPLTAKPMQTKAGEVVDPVTGAAVSGSGSILTPGSLRTRSRSAIAEPDFRDALQTFLGHSRQLEFWKAYYDLAVEANAVLGNREVMNAVHAKGGTEAATALRQWIDAIAQGGFRDVSARLALMRGVGRVVGRASGVALLGRVSALLVQSTQLAAASVQMPVTSYLTRFARLFTGGLNWGDAIRSDFIQRRFKTAPPIVRQAMDGLASARPNAVMVITRFLGNALSGADALFTAGTYAMLLDFHRSQGAASGLSGAELEAYATREAERATEQVAQPTRMTNRSLAEITSTHPLGRVGWAFASESRQKVALAGWALANAGKDPARAAKAVFLTFIIGGMLSQVLKNALRELKGDDDKNLWSPERLAYAATVAPMASAFPLGSLALGDSNMLSNIQRASKSLDDGEIDFRDIDTLLSAAGLFNDTAAGLAQLSHLGLDAAKILQNLAE